MEGETDKEKLGQFGRIMRENNEGEECEHGNDGG